MLFTLAYIYRWKGGRATKLEGSDHIPVYAILTDVPNLHVHNTPSLAVRYIPEVRGWQPTIGEGTILHSFNKLFSSIICVIKIAIDLNMLHTKRNKNVDRSTQWIRRGLLSKRHYFFSPFDYVCNIVFRSRNVSCSEVISVTLGLHILQDLNMLTRTDLFSKYVLVGSN